MTIKEFRIIGDIPLYEKPPISVDDLKNKSNRTLIYGYTLERDTFHVYLKNMKIHVIVYGWEYGKDKPKYVIERKVESNLDYIPSKRIYPEASDFEFCALLTHLGCNLPFTVFDDDRSQKQYYGFVLEDE